MKKVFCLVIAGMFLMVASAAYAQQKTSAAQARMHVEKAAKHFTEVGKKKGLADFSDNKGQWVKGDLYIFVWSFDGVVLANGVDRKAIGTKPINNPDVDGKFFRKDAISSCKTKGTSWTDYKYKNAKTGQIEQKTTYCKKVEDVCICAGAYK